MVYFIQEINNPTGLIKIGKTKDLAGILANLQTSSLVQLVCLNVIEDANDDRHYHNQFASSWHHGEWFSPTDNLLSFIKNLPLTKYVGFKVVLSRAPVQAKKIPTRIALSANQAKRRYLFKIRHAMKVRDKEERKRLLNLICPLCGYVKNSGLKVCARCRKKQKVLGSSELRLAATN